MSQLACDECGSPVESYQYGSTAAGGALQQLCVFCAETNMGALRGVNRDVVLAFDRAANLLLRAIHGENVRRYAP